MLDWLLYTITKPLTIAPAASTGEPAGESISKRCLTQQYFDLWDCRGHYRPFFFLLWPLKAYLSKDLLCTQVNLWRNTAWYQNVDPKLRAKTHVKCKGARFQFRPLKYFHSFCLILIACFLAYLKQQLWPVRGTFTTLTHLSTPLDYWEKQTKTICKGEKPLKFIF